MMAWKPVLFIAGVTVAAVAYWLYTPLPDGYSCESVVKIQIFCAVGKVIDLLVGVPLLLVPLYATCKLVDIAS